jgi:hypothetical protein
MGAKHRMTDLPGRRRMTSRARRSTSSSTTFVDVACASVLCAAGLAGLVVSAVASETPSRPADVVSHGQPLAPQSVSQEGTLIAVSAESVTARSANGYTQTYQVGPSTTLITPGFDAEKSRNAERSQPAPAIARFKINDEVEIVGTIHGGTALATAVADRDAGTGDGPPMDQDGSQPGRA